MKLVTEQKKMQIDTPINTSVSKLGGAPAARAHAASSALFGNFFLQPHSTLRCVRWRHPNAINKVVDLVSFEEESSVQRPKFISNFIESKNVSLSGTKYKK
jgi:hypothetical protein